MSGYNLANLSHPDQGAAVTPHDSNELTNAGVLYVGGAGNIVAVTEKGDEVTFNSVSAGSFIPVRVKQVKATGTTATNILVLW